MFDLIPYLRDIETALLWRARHVDHVANLVANAPAAYPPSGSDCSRPELWKGAHWKWFQGVEMMWKDHVRALVQKLGRRPTLGELLEIAKTYKMTPEEIQAQRESFARHNIATGDPRFD